MKRRSLTIATLASLGILGCGLAGTAGAIPIGITEFSVMLASPQLDPDPGDPTYNALQHVGIGDPSYSDFSAYGLDAVFTNGLDADNLGTASWSVTNNTGFDLGPFWLFGFLDADVDTPFWNDYGTLIDVSGTGSADTAADSWEIAEPYSGYGLTGQVLIDDLLTGALSDSNDVPSSAPEDVGLALGFAIAGLAANQVLDVRFQLSPTDIGGLQQTAASTGESFYFNGTADVRAAAVPAPGVPALLLFAPLVWWGHRRARNRRG